MSNPSPQCCVKSFSIFPQWSDAELNGEKWDPEPKKEETKKTTYRRPTILPQSESFLQSSSSLELDEQVVDTQQFLMPPSLAKLVVDWKRPAQLFRDTDFTLTGINIKSLDLKSGSNHILQSAFMRDFVSSITILEYLSTKNVWPLEGVNQTFFPNTEGFNWKPWHHVYALCKAGKGQQHSPKYNKYGKYALRLFWMGCWRKIIIDDSIPVDANGRSLLPGYPFTRPVKPKQPPPTPAKSKDSKDSKKGKGKDTKSSKSSKDSKKKKVTVVEVNEYEIWPLLLCKGLLKIAALSWTEENEINDYSAITCLTGWIFQKLYTKNMSAMEIWNVCQGYSPKYTYDEDQPKKKPGKADKGGKKDAKDKKGKKDKGSVKSKNEPYVPEEEDTSKLYCLVGLCSDLKHIVNDITFEDMPVEWCQEILIEQYRDCPLIKPAVLPELARWKRFRWLKWAISKGLWPADDLSIPIRCLKFFSSLNKPPEERSSSMKLVKKRSASRASLRSSRSMRSGAKTKSKSSLKSVKSQSSKSTSRTSVTSVKSKKSKKGEGKVKIFPVADKSMWIEFSDIEDKFISLSVFFRPSSFNNVVRVSDLFPTVVEAPKGKEKGKKDAGADKSRMDFGYQLQESSNQSRMIVLNNIGPKLLIINLTTCGKVERVSNESYEEESYGYVLMTEFCWYTHTYGPARSFLRTDGTKSTLLHLKPGKSILRMFLRSTRNFVVSFLSNTQISFGLIHEIIDAFTQESFLLQQTTQDVCTAFGKLINSFGTPTYVENSRNFHKSYKSDVPLTKKESRSLYNNFINILIDYVQDNDLLFALRVLFLDPKIGKAPNDHSGERSIGSYTTSYKQSGDTIELIDLEKLRQMSAIKLQAFFKGICERKLYKMHKVQSQQSIDVYEKLRKIYNDYFSVAKRQNCLMMLRNLYLTNPLLKSTELYTDLVKTLEFKTIKGTTVGYSWTFLTRQKFVVTASEHSLRVRFSFSCDARDSVLRVFDNDTFEEQPSSLDTPLLAYYAKNENGYTLLCYGHSEQQMKITWQIGVIALKRSVESVHLIEDTPSMITLSEVYCPNVKNTICRCILEVFQSTYVTIRLSTSGKYADIKLALYNSDNKVVSKIRGVQNIIIPLAKIGFSVKSASVETVKETKKTKFPSAAKLKTQSSKNKSLPALTEPQRYYIEATVEPNTWPLTAAEWLNTKLENKKYLLDPPDINISTMSLYKNLKSGSVMLKSETEKMSPYWQLTVIQGSRDTVLLNEDMTRRDEINEIKKTWYDNDPDRKERSREIRDNYLQDLCSQAAECCSVSKEMEFGIMSEHSIASDILLHRWIPETIMLPTFALSDYYTNDDYEEPIYPTIAEWDTYLEKQMAQLSLEANEVFLECQDRMENVMTQQVEVFGNVRCWYNDLREVSSDMSTRAYASRQKYLDAIKAAADALKPKKEGKPDKKGKKGKK